MSTSPLQAAGLSLLTGLALSLPSLSAQNPAAAVEGLITEKSIASCLRFLADDLLEGRGVASRGDALSRLYIGSQMQLFGLEPGAPGGGWNQKVPILGITAAVDRPFTVKGPKGELNFSDPDDYTSFAAQAQEFTEWKDAEIVFVGYGINAPELDWDDYKDVDLKGKVLLVMNSDPETELFAGKTRLYYGRWSYKYEEAARRGAVGAIVIHTTPSAGYPFQVIQAGQGQERFWLPFTPDEPTIAIRSWCSEDAAMKITALGGQNLDDLRSKAESRDFRPVPLGVTADLATRNTIRELESGNVLGILPGSDPNLSGEVVAITAHFDHLGRGRPKGEDDIYNGALDNASGTAAMLNIARACASLPEPPKRTLLFLAVTAEESGLLGSLYYARNPTFPKKKIIANFNIDGINIWGATRDLAMIGYGKNSLTAVAHEVAENRDRKLVANPETELGLFYRSDHFSFARIGVPSAFFKAGSDFFENAVSRKRVKMSYTATRYHQPNDEFDERWRLDGAVADSRLILECMLRVANAQEAPTWAPGDEFEKLR